MSLRSLLFAGALIGIVGLVIAGCGGGGVGTGAGRGGTTGGGTTGGTGSTTGGNETGGDEGNENIHAAITRQQAETAALAAKPGTVTSTELGLEDTLPVYSVNIRAADGKDYDVHVNGNTGAILLIDDGANDQNDTGGDGGESGGQ